MNRIFISPLDWGLGHATRCIPIIRNLLQQNNEIYIGAESSIESLLREEFLLPAEEGRVKFIPLKGYRISYSSVLPAWLKILTQLPFILISAIREHLQLKKIIADYKIDTIISDNRFGLWNKKIHSIYITHQLLIKCPKGFKIFEPLLSWMHRWVINHFNECWIPDYEGTENLSGDLSHAVKKPSNAKFIGPLSRFSSSPAYDSRLEFTPTKSGTYDLCIILSGPEPARTKFEQKIFEQLKNYKGNYIVVLGKPRSFVEALAHKRQSKINDDRIVSHLKANELRKVICQSKLVICRAGYSSIMDLHALKKQAVLIPTPGQTEQEYLANYLSEKKLFQTVEENELKLTSYQ